MRARGVAILPTALTALLLNAVTRRRICRAAPTQQAKTTLTQRCSKAGSTSVTNGELSLEYYHRMYARSSLHHTLHEHVHARTRVTACTSHAQLYIAVMASGAGASCCGCGHPDDCEGVSVWREIDLTHVIAANAAEGSAYPASVVFRPVEARREKEGYIDAVHGDPLLVFRVPFKSAIRLRGICVSGGPDPPAPVRMKLWPNREELDMADIEEAAGVQEIDCPTDVDAEIFHPLKTARFTNVFHLTIALYGDASDMRVYYIGLRGDATGV